MIKRIMVLVLISSLIGAGLLYLGITIMGQFYPVLVPSSKAPVAETNVQKPLDLIHTMDSNSLAKELNTIKQVEIKLTPTVADMTPSKDPQPDSGEALQAPATLTPAPSDTPSPTNTP